MGFAPDVGGVGTGLGGIKEQAGVVIYSLHEASWHTYIG